ITSSCIAFGGTTLYAPNEKVLNGAIAILKESINKATFRYLILSKPTLNKLVREDLGETPERLIFGAVLGNMLCLGDLETLTCLTVNSRTFPVFLNAARTSKLDESLMRVEKMLCSEGTLSPREVQRSLFPQREYTSYAASMFLLASLAYRGRAVYLDKE